MQFGLNLYGAWWFSLIYIIFGYGLWFIFPKFVQIRFSKIPYIKLISPVYKYTYIFILVATIFIPLKLNIYFYLGLIIYILGLFMYISAIFYFSINEIDLPVTSGIYKYSRHPVYLGFFIMWIGVAVSTFSIVILLLTLVIGLLSYKIALYEEIDCINLYKKNYIKYKKRTKIVIGKK